MTDIQLISLATGILGSILGAAGLTISILAYHRDRPKVKVTLVWDLAYVDNPKERIGVVKVTNIGRRPIYISAVALQLPKKYEYDNLLLWDSVHGKRLDEGDGPFSMRINYSKLSQYKSDWDKIRAYAEDSAGKSYYSDCPRKKPSWAQ